MRKQLTSDTAQYLLAEIDRLRRDINRSMKSLDKHLQENPLAKNSPYVWQAGWLMADIETTILPKLDEMYSVASREIEYTESPTDNNALSSGGLPVEK